VTSDKQEQKKAALWIGTEDGGIICYRQGAFITYTTRDGLPDNAIRGIQDDGAGGKQELHEISDTVSQSIDEVREIAYNLRPYQLDEIGLTRTVQAMLRKVASASGIHFSVELDPVDGLFSKEDEITFYRILQECVNNLVKHAQATTATVTIRREEQAIAVTIEDDGKGFSVDAPPAVSGKKGFGLTGIAERVRMLGGQQTIRSTEGHGTVVSIMIPFDQTKRGGNGK
jgi:signal transduction histidine kinase